MKRISKMKMKMIIITTWIMGAAMVSCGWAVVETWAVDTNKSSIIWIGKKIGGQHEGTLKLKSGKLLMDKNTDNKVQIQAGSEFVADLTSLDNTDIKDPGMKQKLLGHLKSDDFFSVEKYPHSHFIVKKVQSSKTPGEFILSGDFEIKGIKQAVSVPLQLKIGPKEVVGDAHFSLDRTLWNIRYGSGKFFQNLGDKVIRDMFDLEVHLIATKK